MKKLVWIIFILPIQIFAQDKGALGIEFNVDYNQYTMDELNESTDEVFASYASQINRSRLKNGMSYWFGINIHPHRLFNLGMYSNYLIGRSINKTTLITGGEFGTPVDTIYGSRNQDASSIVIGVKSTLFISDFKFWGEKKWLSKIESMIDVGAGYSFSQLSTRFVFSNKLPGGQAIEINKVTGYHFSGKLKLGYVTSNSLFFSSVGVSIGYQQLVTSRLKGGVNYFFDEENAPRLDFSGLTAGIYVTFGK